MIYKYALENQITFALFRPTIFGNVQDFSEQPSVELGDATGVIWPKCEYSVRQETVDGPVAREVRIGDPIVHRWKCDNGELILFNGAFTYFFL